LDNQILKVINQTSPFKSETEKPAKLFQPGSWAWSSLQVAIN